MTPYTKIWKLKTDRESAKEKEQKEKEKRAKVRQCQEGSDSEPEEVADDPQPEFFNLKRCQMKLNDDLTIFYRILREVAIKSEGNFV